MSFKGVDTIIHSHYTELRMKYPNLNKMLYNRGLWKISGNLLFCATYNNITIVDEYNIEIIIPKKYPKEPPTVKEIGNRIPLNFHPGPNGTLCLDVPHSIRRKFSNSPNLIFFVEKILIHFLFSWSHFEKYGTLPFGEYSHGGKGILESYYLEFNLLDDFIIFEFLKMLSEENLSGHHMCPCGSGNKLRNCHHKKLIEISKYQNPNDFYYEYEQVYIYLNSKIDVPKNLISKKLKHKLEMLNPGMQ